MTYNGVPIMDVEHPALRWRSGIRYGRAWRDAQAAATVLGVDYDTFMELDRETRLTVVAQYEIGWRIEALLAFERQEEAHRQAARRNKTGRK